MLVPQVEDDEVLKSKGVRGRLQAICMGISASCSLSLPLSPTVFFFGHCRLRMGIRLMPPLLKLEVLSESCCSWRVVFAHGCNQNPKSTLAQ